MVDRVFVRNRTKTTIFRNRMINGFQVTVLNEVKSVALYPDLDSRF